MAGTSGRFTTIIKAKISRLLDRAEDPGETLDYSYQKQLELSRTSRRASRRSSPPRSACRCRPIASAAWSSSTRRPARRCRRQGGPRPDRARAQAARPDRAAVPRHAGRRARGPAAEADRLRGEAAHEDRGLPHQEGGRQGAVLGGRGAGADLVRGHRRGRGDGRRRPRDAAGARQDRGHEGARLRRRGARGGRHVRGLTPLGAGQDDIDRQLHELTSQPAVDDDLAKMKAELGQGSGGTQPQIEEGAA